MRLIVCRAARRLYQALIVVNPHLPRPALQASAGQAGTDDNQFLGHTGLLRMLIDLGLGVAPFSYSSRRKSRTSWPVGIVADAPTAPCACVGGAALLSVILPCGLRPVASSPRESAQDRFSTFIGLTQIAGDLWCREPRLPSGLLIAIPNGVQAVQHPERFIPEANKLR